MLDIEHPLHGKNPFSTKLSLDYKVATIVSNIHQMNCIKTNKPQQQATTIIITVEDVAPLIFQVCLTVFASIMCSLMVSQHICGIFSRSPEP